MGLKNLLGGNPPAAPSDAPLPQSTRALGINQGESPSPLSFDQLLDSTCDYATDLAERISGFLDRRSSLGFLDQAVRLDYGAGLLADWISQVGREHRYSTPECRSAKIAATQVRWFLEDALKSAESNDTARMTEALSGLRESLQTLLGDVGRLINTMRQDAVAIRKGQFNLVNPQDSRMPGPFETIYQPL
jgi:hypothetical protein